MDDGILQDNELYRRIQYKNAFRAFAKSYRCTLSRPKHRSNLTQTIKSTLPLKRQSLTHNTYTHLSQTISNNPFLHQEEPRSQFLQRYSSTLPLQHNYQFQNFHSTINSTNCASECALSKISRLRRDKQFKIRSSQGKQRLTYQAPIDESEFSTIQLRKKQLLGNSQAKFRRITVSKLRQTNEQKTIKDISKSALLLSRHSKLSQQGLKQHLKLLIQRKNSINIYQSN